MDDKKYIIRRLYTLYAIAILVGIGIIGRIAFIQFIEGSKWKTKAENLTTKLVNIEAVRGNIFATDGSLLATSVPIYEIRFDPNADAISDEYFNQNVDSLAYSLSTLLNDKSTRAWKQALINARNGGSRYFLVKRNASYNELKAMRDFPIFRKGRFKGGFIYLQQNKRQKPFQVLAARTIGYDIDGIKPVGLEGAYKEVLRGKEGKRLMQKIAGGVWMPLSDENEVDPEDGKDLITTIDLNIQDVAENALLTQLKRQDADHGCVVLMEVQTGEIKAIANLSRNENGNYYENYNYAIGESTEPGSTFKLASYMVALEDGYIDIHDSIETGQGVFEFYDTKMYDSHKEGFGKITVKRAFEVSSNIAIAKIINQHYGKNPQKFIDGLYSMNLNKPLGIEIFGEGKPYIKSVSEDSWSGISLPWISHGYELSQTPLQILTFYNAVANNGKMIKPKFVREIRHRGKVIKSFDTEVINPGICSQSTIQKVREMLEGVVQEGTATNLKNANYKIAGKTGTAQIANEKYGYRYDSKVSYQASFCGYFPAENPKYSCIVVVNAPSRNVYYGNLVAGPIFKEIADKVYATSIEIHKDLDETQYAKLKPASKSGYKSDLETVFASLEIPANGKTDGSDWINTYAQADEVKLKAFQPSEEYIPDVRGMDAQDAIYILENLGVQVIISGRGAVRTQSVKPGTNSKAVKQIVLELS